jgi:hypothetical protein
MVDEKGVEETSDRYSDHHPSGQQSVRLVAGKRRQSPLLHKQPEQETESNYSYLCHDKEVLIVGMGRNIETRLSRTRPIRLDKPSRANTYQWVVLNDLGCVIEIFQSPAYRILHDSHLGIPLHDTGNGKVHPFMECK